MRHRFGLGLGHGAGWDRLQYRAVVRVFLQFDQPMHVDLFAFDAESVIGQLAAGDLAQSREKAGFAPIGLQSPHSAGQRRLHDVARGFLVIVDAPQNEPPLPGEAVVEELTECRLLLRQQSPHPLHVLRMHPPALAALPIRAI